MKKVFAIAAATAMLAAGGSAFAADRLSDHDMDAVSAGAFIKVTQSNNAIVEPLQAVEVKSASWASKGGEVENKIIIAQNTSVRQVIVNRF